MTSVFDQQSILLVDDEDFSRSMVSQMLRRLGFGNVSVASDGFEAIEQLKANPPTAVLTDFRMPGITGLQLLKAIRVGQTRAVRNLPCAMLTSYAERNLVGLAIVLDVDTFLAKPVSFETLNKHLSRMFQYRFEPQPVGTYESVAVEHAAPHLTIPSRPTPAAAPASQPEPPVKTTAPVSEAEVLKDLVPPAEPSRPAPRPPQPSSPPPIAVTDAPPDSEPPRGVKVSLAEIPENAVLAADIVGAGGILLLAKGTPFKRRYAKRLEELKESLDHVWIEDQSGSGG